MGTNKLMMTGNRKDQVWAHNTRQRETKSDRERESSKTGKICFGFSIPKKKKKKITIHKTISTWAHIHGFIPHGIMC